jgi:hypothetical protein
MNWIKLMKFKFINNYKLTSIYIVLCLLALLYIPVSSMLSGGKIELAGILVFTLGLPWSLLSVLAFTMSGVSSAWAFAIGFIVSCIINIMILYKKESN